MVNPEQFSKYVLSFLRITKKEESDFGSRFKACIGRAGINWNLLGIHLYGPLHNLPIPFSGIRRLGRWLAE